MGIVLDGSIAWLAVLVLCVVSGLVIIPRPAIGVLAGLTLGLAAFPLALAASVAGALLAFVLDASFQRTLCPHARSTSKSQNPGGGDRRRGLAPAVAASSRFTDPCPDIELRVRPKQHRHVALRVSDGDRNRTSAVCLRLPRRGRARSDRRPIGFINPTDVRRRRVAVLLLVIGMVTRRVRQTVRTKLTDAPQSH